jgi:hypothetical protein
LKAFNLPANNRLKEHLSHHLLAGWRGTQLIGRI